MYVKPCRNCPHKDGCKTKVEKLAALRGLGITSVNFKCDKRLSELQPGQRIEFTMGDGKGCDWSEYTFHGVVMRPRGSKLLVWLVSRDDDVYEDMPGPHPQVYEHLLESDKNPIKLSPDRVRPVGGRVSLCPDCDQPDGTKPAEERKETQPWFCPRCAGWELVRDRLGFEEWVKPKERKVS